MSKVPRIHRLGVLGRALSKWLSLSAATVTLIYVGHATDQRHRQLQITLERAPDDSQEVVALKATVTNVSKRDILVGEQNPAIDYLVSVTNTQGVPVPLSAYGKKFFSHDRPSSSRSLLVTLRPGERISDTWAIGGFFAFTKPGSYIITVRRTFAVVHETDSSNPLQVTLAQ